LGKPYLFCRTGDRFLTTRAALGEELSVAVGTELLVVLCGELFVGQQSVTVAALEALGVHRRAAVLQPALVDYLRSFQTTSATGI